MTLLNWLLWPSNPLESPAGLSFWVLMLIFCLTVAITGAASLVGVI